MPSQTKTPGTISESCASGSEASWSSLGNVSTRDGTLATATTGTGGVDDTCSIVCSDFGFTIPSDQEIILIDVVVRCKRGPAGGALLSPVRLYNATAIGVAKSAGAIGPTVSDYSISDDVDGWEAELSVSDVNSTDFGCVVKFTEDTDTPSVSVDVVEMTVYYIPMQPPTVSVTLAAQLPYGPPPLAPSTSVSLVAQPPAIETAPVVSITLAAQVPAGPLPSAPTVGLSLDAFEPIGPYERPPTQTVTLVVQEAIQPAETLRHTVAVLTFGSHPVTVQEITTGVAIFGTHVEALGHANVVGTSTSIVSPIATTAIVATTAILVEPLEPSTYVAISDAIGESELLEETNIVATSQLLPSPLAMTAIVATAPTLFHPLERTAIIGTSQRLNESVEVNEPLAIVHSTPALVQPVEALSAATYIAVSSLQRPLETTHIVSVSTDLVQLPDAPLATTAIVATSSLHRPMTPTQLVAVLPDLVSLPDAPLDKVTIVAVSSSEEPLTTAAVIAISNELVQLPDVPIDTTYVVGTSAPIGQPIEQLTTTHVVGVSDRLGETIEQLTKTVAVGMSSQQRPLVTTRIVGAVNALVALPDIPLPQTTVVATAQSVVQPIEIVEATNVIGVSHRLTETIEVIEQTNVVVLSSEHGQGYLTMPVGVFVAPRIGC